MTICYTVVVFAHFLLIVAGTFDFKAYEKQLRETRENCLQPAHVNPFFCFQKNTRRFRTTSGFCNNYEKPTAGGSNTKHLRLLKAKYFDKYGLDTPYGHPSLNQPNVPSAQDVSDAIFNISDIDQGNKRNLSHMFMTFGQFLTHDIALTLHGFGCRQRCNPTKDFRKNCFPIPRRGTFNTGCMRFKRSFAACPEKKQSKWSWRQAAIREQVNSVTSFIDGSMIYGSELFQSRAVRDNSLLQTQSITTSNGKVLNNLLPFDISLPQPCQIFRGCFLAGDLRVNQNPPLIAMHTVWVRLHNHYAKEVRKYTSENVFNKTRNIVVSILQHIVYEEWLPYLTKLDKYEGYNSKVTPGIFNGFTTAAFRFGHTLIRNNLEMLSPKFVPVRPKVPLRDTFDNIGLILEDGIEPTVFGLIGSQSEREPVERTFSASVGKHLFSRSNGFRNLAALDIQRGRDHGLPSYTKWRAFCELKDAKATSKNSFDIFKNEIKNENVRDRLKKLYEDPFKGHVDLFPAGLSEEKANGSILGPTFKCIIKKQFENLRDGDRFFYKNREYFSEEQIHEVEKMSLAKVLCLTLEGIEKIPRNVFEIYDPHGKDSCEKLLKENEEFLNVKEWVNNPVDGYH